MNMKKENKQVKTSTADSFLKKLKIPDRAKAYLFMVTFAYTKVGKKNHNVELVNDDDLMIRVSKVEFNTAGTMFVTFCEYQDFKVNKILTKYMLNETKLFINISYFDDKFEKQLYTDNGYCYKCTAMRPLNLDVTSKDGLMVEGIFTPVKSIDE